MVSVREQCSDTPAVKRMKTKYFRFSNQKKATKQRNLHIKAKEKIPEIFAIAGKGRVCDAIPNPRITRTFSDPARFERGS